MNSRNVTSMLVALLLAACGDSGPPVSATDVQVVAPAPGRTASVAYFTLQNNSDSPSVLVAIDSKQFGNVELHETVLEDGVARMRPVGQVAVAPGESVAFTPGGKHVMLMQPEQAFTPGAQISLILRFAAGNELLVEAPLATRLQAE